jgi:putative addiction module component (TIGR02574 family)
MVAMVNAALLAEAEAMSPADRLELIERVWASLTDDPMVEGQFEAMAERARYLRDHPGEAIPWDEFEADLDRDFA